MIKSRSFAEMINGLARKKEKHFITYKMHLRHKKYPTAIIFQVKNRTKLLDTD